MVATMATIELLRRFWKPAAVLLLLLVTWLHGHHTGDTSSDREWSSRWHQHIAEDMEQVAKYEAAARDQEQKWAAAFDVSAQIQHEELTNAQKHRDRLLADLRAGRLRLQACPAAQVSDAPADSGKPSTAETGGQPAMVGELVNRIAVCDEVVLERNQAVELLRAERR